MGSNASSFVDLSQCSINSLHLFCSHYGTAHQLQQEEPMYELTYTTARSHIINPNEKCPICGLLITLEISLVKQTTTRISPRSTHGMSKYIVDLICNP